VAEITFAPDWRRGPPITDPNTAHKTQREKPMIRKALALLAHAPIKAQQTRLLSEGEPRRSWVGTWAAHGGRGGETGVGTDNKQTKGTYRPFFVTHKGRLIWPRNHTCRTNRSTARPRHLNQCAFGGVNAPLTRQHKKKIKKKETEFYKKMLSGGC